MNNSTIAKNGFKTFILTLAVSLVAFSVIYYIQTDVSNKINIESTDAVGQLNEQVPPKQVTSAAPVAVPATTTEPSVFKALADDKTYVPQRVVLAGSTTRETTQSTVPPTGVTEITYAFVISLSLALFGAYLFVYESRRKALLSFERDVRRDLN